VLQPAEQAGARLQAHTAQLAIQKMGGIFSGIGGNDLAAGAAFLRRSHQPPAFSWIATNLVSPETGEPLFTPILRQEVNGVRIAILALTDPGEVAPQPGLRVVPWQDCLPDALKQARQGADCIILLSNHAFNDNVAIARQHGDIDLIFQAGHAIGNRPPQVVRNTLILQTQTRGQTLGVLDIDWKKNGTWMQAGSTGAAVSSTYLNRFINISPSIPRDQEIEALIRENMSALPPP
jgi:2',3'-cyclic-nucleotide 2'-phosphodiesterase (5'-nucleotidase family)